jgi:dGTP triphosphohydrolase
LGSEPKEGQGLAVRRHVGATAKPEDPRLPSQVDHDRIIYSSAFRRLAQVGQVVSSSEGHVFHNRLTHSLKVAQIARRLAERLRTEDTALSRWPDPDLAEAAALAHDLAHPPFGHIAEETLDRLVHEPATDIKLRFLQHLVWKFVISGRRVGSQQLGQTRIIERLVRVFYRSAMETLKPELDLIPHAFEDQLDGVRGEAVGRRRPRAARLAADVVSSLTEDQARTLHGRYCGTGLGSVQDRIEA